MTLTAGIDAGTQSIKVLVYDSDARRAVASASAPLELISGDDGSREQHPDAWVEAVSACFYHSPGWGKDYPRIQILSIAVLLHGPRSRSRRSSARSSRRRG